MTASHSKVIDIPGVLTRSEVARTVLNGSGRRERMLAQQEVVDDGSRLGLRQRVLVSLIVDLRDSGWLVRPSDNGVGTQIRAPRVKSRSRRKAILGRWRQKNPSEDRGWLDAGSAVWLKHLIRGRDLDVGSIAPNIHPCETSEDHALFRFLNATWSAPQGRYLGRRLRFIVRDHGQVGRPVIGILALGSSIVRSRERDAFIGWGQEEKRQNLINIMDITVLGAVPPYSYLLGGKLMCYIAASDQIRNFYRRRYRDQQTIQLKRKANDLALLVTSSLFGRSALYNRVRFDGEDLFEPIGETEGFGTVHLSQATLSLMYSLLDEMGEVPRNRFGDGPNWKMRLVRSACDALGISHHTVLNHGLEKSLYAIRTAHNSLEFLAGDDPKLRYKSRPMKRVVEFWRERWLQARADRVEIKDLVADFDPVRWAAWK